MAAEEGNTYSSKNNRLLTDTLRRACVQSPEKLRGMCDAIVERASGGDLAAASFIFDRLEGKAVQQTVLSGDEDNPLNVITRIELAPMNVRRSD